MRYTSDKDLPEITEQQFQENLQKTKLYTVLILKTGPRYQKPGPERDPAVTAIVKEHGKRNMALLASGIMPVVCPIGDGTNVTGIAVFDTTPEETTRIYSEDPGVRAGVFTFDVHPCRSFPGSTLPS
ncbi:MAG TPA: hypothetical protein VL354_06075 [Spirochaetia bacterium]|nr:hypothetical protein [Spirochaetia bacterium]